MIPIYSAGGLEIRAECSDEGPVVTARSLSNDSTLSVQDAVIADFDAGQTTSISGAGTLLFRNAGGVVISMIYSVIGEDTTCLFLGTVVDS